MLLLPFSLSAPIPSNLGHLIKQPLTHHSSTILTPSTSLWPKNPIHSIHPLHCACPLCFLVIIKKSMRHVAHCLNRDCTTSNLCMYKKLYSFSHSCVLLSSYFKKSVFTPTCEEANNLTITRSRGAGRKILVHTLLIKKTN